MDAPGHALISSLLFSLLSCVLIVGMVVAYLVIRWRRESLKLSRLGILRADDLSEQEISPYQHLWKRPNCWLAVKHDDLQAVQSAFALHNPKPCPWIESLSGDGDPKLFISPPVAGWILVMGPALPDPSDDIDICFRFLINTSRKLGHIQFFNANTMLNHHAWAQLNDGRIIRGYAWAGQTLWNQGDTTQAELDLKMKCYEYTEVAGPKAFGSFETCTSDAEKVHRLAARWSVDPDDIDERLIEDQWGIIGELSGRF